MATVILLNPMGTDVTNFVNGTFLAPQLLKGSIMQPGDTLYTLPYKNEPGIANIEAGVPMLDAKLKSVVASGGKAKVVAYSEGGQIADMWLANNGPTSSVPPESVSFLLIANADRKYGGFVYGHSIFDNIAYTGGKPDDTPYSVIEFTRQWDGVADFPGAQTVQDALVELQSVADSSNALPAAISALAKLLKNSPYAMAAENAAAGAFLIHDNYFQVTVGDSANVSYTEPGSNITWMWSPTSSPPMGGNAAEIETAFTRPVAIPL